MRSLITKVSSKIIRNILLVILVTLPPSLPMSLHAQCTVIPSDIETSINTTIQRYFEQHMPDIEEHFNRLWYNYNIDEIYREAVREAMDSTKSEYNLWNRYTTPFSKKKINDYFEKIEDKIGRNEDLNNALHSLNLEMSQWISEKLTINSQLATADALYCMIRYLKSEGGDAIAGAFLNTIAPTTEENLQPVLKIVENRDISNGFVIKELLKRFAPIIALPAVSIALKSPAPTAVLAEGSEAAEVAVSSEVSEEIAGSIAKRAARKVITKVITPKSIGLILTAVTVGLVAYQIYKLPGDVDKHIYEKLVSPKTIYSIKDSSLSPWIELSHTIPTELTDQLSDTLITLWKDFQTNYNNLLNILQRHPELKNNLNEVPIDKLPLVSTLASRMTEEKFVEELSSGKITDLLNLPDKYIKPAMKIAESLNDISLALNWIMHAGPIIDSVISKQLYLYFDPQNLPMNVIQKLSQLPTETITKLKDYDPNTVTNIINLIPENLVSTIVDSLPTEDLSKIVNLASKIDPASRRYLFAALSNNLTKWENVIRISKDILKALPAKRKDLIDLALSNNPIIRVKKAVEYPSTGIKMMTHDKNMTIIYGLISLLAISVLAIVLYILKTFVSLLLTIGKTFKRR